VPTLMTSLAATTAQGVVTASPSMLVGRPVSLDVCPLPAPPQRTSVRFFRLDVGSSPFCPSISSV